ncbi:DnaJ domain-containing protein [Rhodovarius lipocyclicus]|jgi:hypothetical protein|uniref:DnaJ domain-containing protein n=1 Tax=Rhodovarius lipocyclicus TaxID=268410 RepID=UPI0013583331|nr:DnaJ domain-containing protein [Rhodovarius lipocyclicus]
MRKPRGGARPDPSRPDRPCEAPDCPLPGEYRAPRDRFQLDKYRWFCLDHVREYNRGWDFYKGMSEAQIEGALRQDTGWQRPTWPLGRLGGARLDPEILRDPFHILSDQVAMAQRKAAAEASRPPPELRAALDLLDLGWPIDSLALKTRYKELAKRYHPDTNQGDRSAEERLKDINRAYSLLRHKLAGAEASAR